MKEEIEKKCYKCGSEKVVRIVSANAACIPSVKEQILSGKAEMNCCCAGTGSTGMYRCKDCGFEWDYYYERAMDLKL